MDGVEIRPRNLCEQSGGEYEGNKSAHHLLLLRTGLAGGGRAGVAGGKWRCAGVERSDGVGRSGGRSDGVGRSDGGRSGGERSDGVGRKRRDGSEGVATLRRNRGSVATKKLSSGANGQKDHAASFFVRAVLIELSCSIQPSDLARVTGRLLESQSESMIRVRRS